MGITEYIAQQREKYNQSKNLIHEKIMKLKDQYQEKKDPWGLNLKTLETTLKVLYPLYKNYFKVRTFGMDKIPKDTPFIVAANHSGQIPIDGMLTVMSFILEKENPTILRGMAERFLFKVPFVGKLALESGTILGDRKNCRYLLNHDESIMVFPEGVKGIAKSTPEFYQLKDFTLGFYRLALEKKIPIIPIAIVGAEEFYPYVYHNKTLANILGVPALPLTPHLVPLPSPVDIHICDPIYPAEGMDPDAPNKEIRSEVQKIRQAIQDKINRSLGNRRKMFEDNNA